MCCFSPENQIRRLTTGDQLLGVIMVKVLGKIGKFTITISIN